MVLAARLELRQRQALVITPQLQQAIKLLQFSSIELAAFIEQEAQQNPLLVLNDHTSEAAANRSPGSSADMANGKAETPVFDQPALQNEWQTVPKSEDWTYEPSEWKEQHVTRQQRDMEREPDIGTLAAPDVCLQDHLRAQAYLALQCGRDRFIADYLIDLIEPDGYLRANLSEVGESLGADQTEIARVLRILQSLDPPGVAARSLEECLALQLEERSRLDPIMQVFLKHLDLVAVRDFGRLKRLCRIDDEDLQDMLAELRTLNPRPGLAFEPLRVTPLIPEVIVKQAGAGVWIAELNPETMPNLRVDHRYHGLLKSRIRTDAERGYVAERLSAANWLAKSLEQRGITILKVARAIIETQAGFLEHGVRFLKPLNLRQVAAKIGMHESTVSRVTSNKAMATPRGIFEMKYFFTSAIPSAGTLRQLHSSEAVRDRIKELIAHEAPDAVLSDDRIVTLLQSDGIDIARRTVAKYRESMRIPSSALRRRDKRQVHVHSLAAP